MTTDERFEALEKTVGRQRIPRRKYKYICNADRLVT